MSIAEIESPREIRTSPVEEPLFEVVGDDRVELLPMGAYESVLASEMAFMIRRYVGAQDLGHAAVETLFRIRTKPNLQRRPDVAYVAYERWAKGRRIPPGNAWDVVPDLVVEVVSPTDYAQESLAKIHDYFDAGVRRAWVVYPNLAVVYVYESPRSVQVFDRQDILEGGVVLPGFRLDLNELFGPPDSTPA